VKSSNCIGRVCMVGRAGSEGEIFRGHAVCDAIRSDAGCVANMVVVVGSSGSTEANEENKEVASLMEMKSADEAGGARVCSRSAFVGGGRGAEVVNNFLKNFRSQEVCALVAVFASLRVRAEGGFGVVMGREKKAL